jgi:DNA modification methylase
MPKTLFADKVTMVPLDDIIIEDRLRTSLDPAHIDELADSIAAIDLLVPILLTDNNRLVAGGCRIEAHRKIGRTHIAAVFRNNLQPWELVAMELAENLHRKELSFADEVAGKKRFHDLYLANAPAKRTLGGAPSQKSSWRLADTANLLKVSAANLSRDIELADAIAVNPTLTQFKTKTQAWSAHKRNQEKVARTLVALAVNSTPTQSQAAAYFDPATATFQLPSQSIANSTIYNCPAIDIIDTLTDSSINSIITDPPWNVGYDEKINTDPTIGLNLTREFLEAVKPKLAATFQGWLFCATRHLIKGTIYSMLTDLGYYVADQIFIWYKPNTVRSSHPYSELKNDYEPAVWFSNHLPRHLNTPSNAVMTATVDVRLSPAQKPPSVISHLVELSTVPGELIVDPFCGSGVVGKCANDLNRRSVLVEKDSDQYHTACLVVAGTLTLTKEDSPDEEPTHSDN